MCLDAHVLCPVVRYCVCCQQVFDALLFPIGQMDSIEISGEELQQLIADVRHDKKQLMKLMSSSKRRISTLPVFIQTVDCKN